MPTSCLPVTRAMLGVELPDKGGAADVVAGVSDDPALQPMSAESAIAAKTNEACFTTHPRWQTLLPIVIRDYRRPRAAENRAEPPVAAGSPLRRGQRIALRSRIVPDTKFHGYEGPGPRFKLSVVDEPRRLRQRAA